MLIVYNINLMNLIFRHAKIVKSFLYEFIYFYIKKVGYINTMSYLLDILQFVLKYLIYTLVFLLYIGFLIFYFFTDPLYILDNPIYTLLFVSLVALISGLCF
jgi:hypothetical protein